MVYLPNAASSAASRLCWGRSCEPGATLVPRWTASATELVTTCCLALPSAIVSAHWPARAKDRNAPSSYAILFPLAKYGLLFF